MYITSVVLWRREFGSHSEIFSQSTNRYAMEKTMLHITIKDRKQMNELGTIQKLRYCEIT